jgi:hypothetical protein
MALVVIRAVTSIDTLANTATMSFAVAPAAAVTVYTYTPATGHVTASALSAPYEITLANYLVLVNTLTKWLRDADALLGAPLLPFPGPSWSEDFDVDRSLGKVKFACRIEGTKYADVHWNLIPGDGDVHVKVRPAIDMDRTAFGIFQAAHERFAVLCDAVAHGE